jgi:uncharacterized protein YeaO (DUF488 family)
MNVKIKRVYEEPDASDGCRILIDRLWPRGLTKQKAKVDLWLKAIAPSAELRTWFNHDPGKWAEFKHRYQAELRKNESSLSQLRELLAMGAVTLLYAARDEEHNDAVVLKAYLENNQ